MNDKSDDPGGGAAPAGRQAADQDVEKAVDSFSALAQARRFAVFRLLIKDLGQEFAAGEIGERLSIRPSNLSFHLAHLERAGLIRGRREQRNVYYSANLEGVRSLLGFIVQDCCGGNPGLCGLLPSAGDAD